MFDFVFFDCDGTLLYTSPPASETWARACREFGFAVTQKDVDGHEAEFDEFDRTHFPVRDESEYFVELNTYAMSLLGFAIMSEEARAIQEYFEKNLCTLPFPEVGETLARLRERGVRLGIISNGFSSQRKRLASLGLGTYFELCVLSSEVGYAKPDRRIFLEAARRLGVTPDSALHVGDNYEKDIVGAQNAGMRAVLVDREKKSPHDCARVSTLLGLVDMMDDF